MLKFAKDGKIKYLNGWIYILNKKKHQPISDNIKDNVIKSITKHFEENKLILEKMESPLKAPYKTLPEIEIEIESRKNADKSAGSLSKDLLDYFFNRYKQLTGKEPIITSWARYNKQSKPFVEKYGIEKMKEAVELYFESEDNFIKNNGYPINIFLTDNTLQKLWK